MREGSEKDARTGEDAVVGELRYRGRVVGYHATFIAPSGAKSLVKPLYATFMLEKTPGAAFDIPARGESADTIIAEGLTDALSVSMVSEHRIIGLPGIGNLKN